MTKKCEHPYEGAKNGVVEAPQDHTLHAMTSDVYAASRVEVLEQLMSANGTGMELGALAISVTQSEALKETNLGEEDVRNVIGSMSRRLVRVDRNTDTVKIGRPEIVQDHLNAMAEKKSNFEKAS